MSGIRYQVSGIRCQVSGFRRGPGIRLLGCRCFRQSSVKVFSRVLAPLLTIGIVASSSAQQVTVPFDVCVHSDDWKRPSADVQSRIWRDARYKELGAGAYEWTHNFLSSEPDSASIAYHSQNVSGLWTDMRESQCPRRDRERSAWTEVWALNYRVTGMTFSGLVYSITVSPLEPGYEIIQFRRPPSLGATKTTLRFINGDGRILGEWKEVSPSVFAPVW